MAIHNPVGSLFADSLITQAHLLLIFMIPHAQDMLNTAVQDSICFGFGEGLRRC